MHQVTLAYDHVGERASQPGGQLHILSAARHAHQVNFGFFKLTEVPAEADAIVIFLGSEIPVIQELRLGQLGHLLPVVDLTGRHGADADLSVNPGQPFDHVRMAEIVGDFKRRRRELGSWADNPADQSHRLLAHLWVAQGQLQARYDASRPCGVDYGALLPVADAVRHAERLAANGLLRRKHFDKLHRCPSCGSSRLNVREECEHCRSSELVEVGLLHHYRCAYLGPAHDFEAPDGRLICPKCERELRHYGSDHERAGEAIQCLACGHVGEAAAVGFVCMDCTFHFDAATAQSHVVYSYQVTDAAGQLLKRVEEPGALRAAAPLGNLPLELTMAARRMRGKGASLISLCEIAYCGQAFVESSRGAAGFMKARRHFLDILRARLGRNCILVCGGAYDYLLVNGHSSQTLVEAERAIGESAAQMKDALAVEMHVVNADQYAL